MTKPRNALETVRRNLESAGYLRPSSPLLAAVSGGADSIALLFMLHELEMPVAVAHYDHQTRAGGSTRDAEFVREVADSLGLPFHFASNDVPAIAARSEGSFEEIARELRYLFLIETAEETGCCALVTGHHADDQAETLLMRFLRGTSPRGLAGIPPVGEREGFAVLRPMLTLTRGDILEYLEDRNLAYRDDPSNADNSYTRNRIRHELLPMLTETYNRNLRGVLGRMAEIQREENHFLTAATGAFLSQCLIDSESIDRKAFRYGHVAIQRRAILEIAWEHGAEPDFERVNAAVDHIVHGATGGFCDLGGELQLCNGKADTLLIRAERRKFRQRHARLRIPGEANMLGKRFRARLLNENPGDDLSAYCSHGLQVFDADRLGQEIALRTVRDGDRFAPLGLNGTKKISDYFSDIGLPVPERQRQVLLEAGGEIVWVVGHAIGEYAAITPDTTRFAEVEVGDPAE